MSHTRHMFRSVLHRVLSEAKMDVSAVNARDDSRPAFPRPPYCIGLYLDAIDARPDKNTTVGSQHAFMMSVMDRLQEYLRDLDLSTVKGALEARRVADGIILEGVKHSCIIALTFDSLDALEDIWAMHKKNRLSSLFQDILVDKASLKATCCTKLSLRVKLWEDEVIGCRADLKARPDSRLKLSSSNRDFSMVKRVQEHQNSMPETVSKARDAESRFEHNLGEFMLTIKQMLPQNAQVIKSLKEFNTNLKMARGVKKIQFDKIDHYLQSLEYFRKVFQEVEKEIVHPLCQIQAICENEKQRNLKKTIKKSCREMLEFLRPEVNLEKIRHKEWESKVLTREQGLFYGLISLVPMSVDRLTTIDYSTDEYINDFPEIGE